MTGPLAPFADAYRAELHERGYTPLTTVEELRQVGRLSRWLDASGLTVTDLPADVGAAIAGYLRRGRPASDRREVFLRARAPFRPVAPSTVSSTVRRACTRAGVPAVGAHRLRHTTACEMVAAHVPLVQISQVLRHRSLQSTAIYARVDVDQLRLLAAPWPGGAGL